MAQPGEVGRGVRTLSDPTLERGDGLVQLAAIEQLFPQYLLLRVSGARVNQ